MDTNRLRLKRFWQESFIVAHHPACPCPQEICRHPSMVLTVSGYVAKSEPDLSLVSLAWMLRTGDSQPYMRMFCASPNPLVELLSRGYQTVWLTNSGGFPTGCEQLSRWLIINIPLLLGELRTAVATHRRVVIAARKRASIEGLPFCPFCFGKIDEEHLHPKLSDHDHEMCEWIQTVGKPRQCGCEACELERREFFGKDESPAPCP